MRMIPDFTRSKIKIHLSTQTVDRIHQRTNANNAYNKHCTLVEREAGLLWTLVADGTVDYNINILKTLVIE